MGDINKTHLWMGITNKSKKDFEKYFELDYSDVEIDDENYKRCGFCEDIGLAWYDEDFLGLFGPYKTPLKIVKALEKTVIVKKEYSKIENRLIELGLNEVNAFFYYEDEEINEIDSSKKYNDLFYIGEFEKLSYAD